MNLRQANKIIKQHSLSETDLKCRSYWNRYEKANAYVTKLYNRKFARMRKGGITFLTEEEVDEIVDKAINE